MQLSFLLMKGILELFAIMIMGYLIVKLGILKGSDSKSLSVIIVYLATPCMIINAFQIDATPEVQKGLVLACIAATAVHILYLAVTAVLRKPLHLNVIECTTMIYTNASILVIPLVQKLFGQEYVIYTSAFIMVQIILLWTHCKSLLCGEQKIDWKKIIGNINIISIIIGIILFALHIQLPDGAQNVLNRMSNLMGPLGMLLAGMVIADIPLKTVFTRKRNYLPTVSRLLIYPMLVLPLMKGIYLFSNLTDAKNVLMIVYLASITPACAAVTSMAQLYDSDAAYSSSLYVLTTLLSVMTMPVMSTSAALFSFGYTSAIALPEVITSSMITTFSPSVSFLPTNMPPSPWSLTSLRSKQKLTSFWYLSARATAAAAASGMPL